MILGILGGAASLAGGALSLGGGLLHAGSTAVGLGAKGLGAIGRAAGGLMPGGGTDREVQGGQPHQVGDVNGKYQDRTGRWHDRDKNNQFTTAPAQFGANGFAPGTDLAAGGAAAGGGQQMEMDFGGTGGMNEPGEVGPFGMLIGLLGGMANDISAIKGLTSGILNSMIADESEDDQQDAQMDLFQEQQLAEQQEAQRQAQDLIDKGKREGSLTDTDGDSKKGTSLLGKAFGPIKSGWNKILNQPNWLKALGLGGLLWWLSQNKEGFVKGLTVVLEWVQDLTKKFRNADFEDFTIKGFAANLAEGIGGLFTKIKESETFKTLVSTVWPALRDMIQLFAEGTLAMIYEVAKEFIFGASGDRAIRQFAKSTVAPKGVLSKIATDVGAPGGILTEEIAGGLDTVTQERIDEAKQKLWGNMRDITAKSNGRVQWTAYSDIDRIGGWDPTFKGVHGVLPTTLPPEVSLSDLMNAKPIIDGNIGTFKDLESINLGAVIGPDATEDQTKDIANKLAAISALASESFVLSKRIEKGDLKDKTVKKYQEQIKENEERIAKLNQETYELGRSDKYSAISSGVAESLKLGTTAATDGTTAATDGTTAAVTDEFAGGGGFTFVDGKLVKIQKKVDILPKLSTPTTLTGGIEKDFLNRSQGWDPNFLFKGTLADWMRVRANTIQLGPWDNTEEGKAHWEHQIRVDNMKIIGLAGRDDVHKMANLADPIGYALADLAKGNALNEFVHGTTIGGGAVPVPLANVGANVRTLQGLTTAQLQHIRGDSGTGGNVLVSTGAKTNINSNTVNTANIAAKDKEWTQTILNNNQKSNQYSFV
jgi:hypothetical protein